MVALIPTLMDSDVSIIVAPLNSLITDYKRKLNAMQISFDHYTSKTEYLRSDVNIILVSVDMARTVGWKQKITELNARRDVTRLFFDEAHLVLVAAEYRPALTKLYELRIFDMQFILLTATAPPACEKALCGAFGFGTNHIVLRGPTDRPNLAYCLMPKSSYTPVLLQVQELIKTQLSQGNPEDRILIFVPYRDLGEKLAQDLNCEFYHGQISDPRLQEKMYHKWFNGDKKILIATSSLSAGNDHQHVRLVFHINTPMEMINFIQEVSRAGRDGKPAKCYLFPIGKRKPKGDADIEKDDVQGFQAMFNHIWTPSCQRYSITLFSDGVGVYCDASKNMELCTTCEKGPSLKSAKGPPAEQQYLLPDSQVGQKRKQLSKTSAFSGHVEEAKKRRVDSEQHEIQYISDFERALSLFLPSCAYCTFKGQIPQAHPLNKCPTMQQEWQDFLTWKSNIKFGPKQEKSCYFCYVPECEEHLHGIFDGPFSCKYPDIIPPITFGIYTSLLKADAEKYFGTKWPSIEVFGQWISGPLVPNAKTNISALFLWYVSQSVCSTYLMRCR